MFGRLLGLFTIGYNSRLRYSILLAHFSYIENIGYVILYEFPIVMIKVSHYDGSLEMGNISANSGTADKCIPTDCACVNVNFLDNNISDCYDTQLLGLICIYNYYDHKCFMRAYVS